MRLLLLLPLGACMEGGLTFEQTSTDSSIAADAQLQYTLCDDLPCTSISVRLGRSTDEGYSGIADVSGVAIVDGEPPIDLLFEPDGGGIVGGELTAHVDGWVQSAGFELRAEAEQITMSSDSPITTPFEMAPSLPTSVTLGSPAPLAWESQDYASASVVFARTEPLAFGFLIALKPDEGSFEVSPDVLNLVGVYNIALYRSITLYSDHSTMLWGSNWQQKLSVVDAPID